MDITTKLQDFCMTFETLHELDISGFDSSKGELEEFYDKYEDSFDDNQWELYEQAFALMEMADDHFEPERREAEAEERREDARYLGSECNH